jgi:hypothetical protein
MSVQARSLGSAGRPVFGRPVAAVVAALIATFAVGAPAALADEPPGPGASAADASQTQGAPPAGETTAVDPPVAETPPADPATAEPPPVADAPTGSPPAGSSPAGSPPGGNPPGDGSPADSPPAGDSPDSDPPQSGSPAGNSPPVDPPTADSPSTDPPPAQSPQGQPLGDQATPGPPTGGQDGDTSAGASPAQPAPPTGGNHSAASNQSRVIQAVWQVQQGCRSHCHGTSQTQRSVQVSDTTQRATAIAGESDGGSSAQARNESSTIQFVWQMQIGCVAFCFHTSQSQEAAQRSYTTQEADAQSALTAWAENLAETVQIVFQFQQGCEHECHGVSQHQSSTQEQTTNQSASADAFGDGSGVFVVPDWLIAYAQNIGATIQVIHQYQEALCLEYCMGDAQLQEAIQHAVTDQNAVALAAPPVAQPPVAQPPVGEPPTGEPPPEPAGQSATPEAAPSAAHTAAHTAAATGSARQGFVLGWKRRRTVRRQELVLRAGARSTGGTQAGGGQATSGGGGQATPGGGGQATAGGPAADGPAASGAGFAPAAAGGTSGTGTTSRNSDDDGRDLGAGGDTLPSQTFAVPSDPNAGGSMGWLLILLLTSAVAALVASLRRILATTMTRI